MAKLHLLTIKACPGVPEPLLEEPEPLLEEPEPVLEEVVLWSCELLEEVVVVVAGAGAEVAGAGAGAGAGATTAPDHD